MNKFNRNQIKSFIIEFLKEKTYFTKKSITEAFLISNGIKEKTLIDVHKVSTSMQISPLINELLSKNYIKKFNSKTFKRIIPAEMISLDNNPEDMTIPELVKKYKQNGKRAIELLKEKRMLKEVLHNSLDIHYKKPA